MFRSFNNSGFHIKFDNGVTVSVQFGFGNYCENHFKAKTLNSEEFVESSDAEVAIWDDEGNWITGKYFENINDVVVGHVKPDVIPELLIWASKRG